MKKSILAPSVGESITEVSILKWVKKTGEKVQSGDLLLELESDKATVEIVAEFSGFLSILQPEGARIAIGEIIATIDDTAQKVPVKSTPKATSSPHIGNPATTTTSGPAARKMATEKGIDLTQMSGSGKNGRVTQGDLLEEKIQEKEEKQKTPVLSLREGDRRVPLSHLRARIAERLVQAQQTAAILTTFNEVDLSSVIALRNKHKDAFKQKHGVSLSFMSFFTRATVEALKIVPEINASIDKREIVYHEACDIGIAVGTERGLVVPIIRNTEKMGLVEIEAKIAELALKARNGKLSISDLSGGTFTISNGGVYGSLMSTPILTPPQSAILGMHKIQERPVAIDGKIEIRPMMYLALSYDHRLIDGKGAVTFLVLLKEGLEHPEKLGLEF